jgi:hypothetical protein
MMNQKVFIFFGTLILFFTFSYCGQPAKNAEGSNGTGLVVVPKNTTAIIIDHTSVDASIISDDIMAKIKKLKVYFEHASVGRNIVGVHSSSANETGGLDLLKSGNSKYSLTINYLENDGSSVDSSWIDSNNGLLENMRGNPGLAAKRDRFNTRMRAGDFAKHVNVAMFKFCWIDDASIANDDALDEFNSVRTVMESLESKYPDTVFVWWTMPIATSGNIKRDAYNNLVRNYCNTNKKILMDLADIECHNSSGAKLSDAVGDTLDTNYAADEGHLNDTGKQRVANAWWIMLARICGM